MLRISIYVIILLLILLIFYSLLMLLNYVAQANFLDRILRAIGLTVTTTMHQVQKFICLPVPL